MSAATAYQCIANLFVPTVFYEQMAAEERRRPYDDWKVTCMRRRLELFEAMVLHNAAQRARANT